MSLHLIVSRWGPEYGLYIIEKQDSGCCRAVSRFYESDDQWCKKDGEPFTPTVVWFEHYNMSEPIDLTLEQLKERYKEFLFEVTL